jgi:hypothetical protein
MDTGSPDASAGVHVPQQARTEFYNKLDENQRLSPYIAARARSLLAMTKQKSRPSGRL